MSLFSQYHFLIFLKFCLQPLTRADSLGLIVDSIAATNYSSCTDASYCRAVDAHNESTDPVTEDPAAPGALAHREEKSSFSCRCESSAQEHW